MQEDDGLELEGSARIVADAFDELINGVLSELDLLGPNPPRRARKFLRCRPNFEFKQGDLYTAQVNFTPGQAGTLKRNLEALMGTPKPKPKPKEEP